MVENPDFEKLLTITAEDWAEFGFPDREPQEGRVPLPAILEETVSAQVPRTEGDNCGYIALEAFVGRPRWRIR